MRGQWPRRAVCRAVVAVLIALTGPASAKTAAEADKLNAEVERLYQAGKFAEAIPLAQRALSIREKALGPEHLFVGTSLNNLAGLYDNQGRTAEAEPLYKRGLGIYEKALGSQHPWVAAALNNLAALYESQGRYAEAEPLYKRSHDIWEKALGPEHPDVATSLNNLALLYESQGRYAEAEPLYKRSLVIREAALGPEHPHVGQTLNNLAGLHRRQSRYAEAEPLYKRSLVIREAALGPAHPDVAQSLSNLAGLYDYQGRTAEAEPLYKRSLVIREAALGPAHPDVAQSLNNLAGLYESQGRYAEAAPLYKRAVAIVETALGPEHPLVGTALNNLAGLYNSQGRTAEAEPLYKRALTIRETALGPKHPDVGESLNDLAGLYLAQERTAEAELLYKRSLALRETALGPHHTGVAQSLNNLALLYVAQGRIAEAKPLYLRALTIRETALGPEHPDVSRSLNNLAWHALARSDLADAADHWRRATAVLRRRSERGHSGASEGASKGEAHRNSWYFEGLVKTTHRLAAGDRGAVKTAEMFEIAQWGVGSEAGASLAQMAARSAGGSPQLAALVRERQDLVAEWQARDKLLSAAKSEQPDKRNAASEKALSDRLAAIDSRLAAIDARFAKDFPDYAALARPKPISVADVQGQLGNDEALLLFLDTGAGFKPLPEETFVWVVTKTDVRWLRSELGTAALQREVNALRCGLDATSWNGEGTKRCADLLKLAPGQVTKDGPALPFDAGRAHELYKSLLGEAADLIKGKHLLIVPSGALTTLPFQVLVTEPPKPGALKSVRWLALDHAITVLPSVSSLAALRRIGKASAASNPMIGFGNPLLDGDQAHPQHGAYFREQAQIARTQTGCAKSLQKRTASLRVVARSLAPLPVSGRTADLNHLRMQSPLPETADELCEVARSVGGSVDDVRIGARATEAEVKRLSSSGELGKYRILHFATHGTLAGQLKGTSEPGLILTPPKTATDEDDGYLSGSEIASLKLDADWVILSACNTAGPAGGGQAGSAGQGEAAEALSGLARVFFYAGARALLVSHWEVDSAATVKLITTAMAELAKDKSIGRAEAMRRAMLAVMADTSRPANWVPAWHPSVWAPFVVVGEGGLGR